ncbi:hypothetical protein PGTUg99_029732 [Puccinia graminis f. sp. tritici]|uniref:Uncharacterized protein n=1 Tax=Puccinia graminis f. sp. tritici TaxID=56615 RepID=A0A5B0SLT7_PUCGR|nr:hypothetical protein PGTUg99_029732 [Puccinia graminis f. sp. tritici]
MNQTSFHIKLSSTTLCVFKGFGPLKSEINYQKYYEHQQWMSSYVKFQPMQMCSEREDKTGRPPVADRKAKQTTRENQKPCFWTEHRTLNTLSSTVVPLLSKSQWKADGYSCEGSLSRCKRCLAELAKCR